MHIAQGLAHAVKVAGNRPAISCGETTYTWSQFAYRTNCLARGLAHLGIERGERVAEIVPLNTRLAPPEIGFILNDCEARVLLVDKVFASFAEKCESFSCVQQIVYSGPHTDEAPKAR